MKRVQWRAESGKLIPKLKKQASDHWFRASVLSYGGSNKRRLNTPLRRDQNSFIFDNITQINFLPALKRQPVW